MPARGGGRRSRYRRAKGHEWGRQHVACRHYRARAGTGAAHWGWRAAWAGGRGHVACRATGQGQVQVEHWGWHVARRGAGGTWRAERPGEAGTGAALGLACGVGGGPEARGVPSDRARAGTGAALWLACGMDIEPRESCVPSGRARQGQAQHWDWRVALVGVEGMWCAERLGDGRGTRRTGAGVRSEREIGGVCWG